MKNKMIACREGKNDILHVRWLFIYSTFASTEAGLHFAHHPMIRGYKAHNQVFVS